MQENREEAQCQIRFWWDSVKTSVYEVTLSRLEAVVVGRIEEIHRAAGGGHPSGVPHSESFSHGVQRDTGRMSTGAVRESLLELENEIKITNITSSHLSLQRIVKIKDKTEISWYPHLHYFIPTFSTQYR